jgi:predicted RNase H-like HicB family nuclease
MQKQIKIIVEKHPEGYVAYPVGLKGIVVAEGDTYEEALAEVKSAIEFHVETFGREVLEEEQMAQEVFVAEAGVIGRDEFLDAYNEV